MLPNTVLYKIKTALQLDEAEILRIFELEEYPMSRDKLRNILAHPKEKHFSPCDYETLGVFLDGLITYKRGPSPRKKDDDTLIELTNNLILKKLRIALKLEEMETDMIFALGGAKLSKQELKSLFRKEDHKNFKACGDDLLLAFLDGLDEFYYEGEK
jgi:uncharacterized protein YehS (DUF1456 family)